MLANYFDFEDLLVLDLFAGTGSISYEFASRGAQVDCIEKDSRSVEFIKRTVQNLKIENINVRQGDVFKLIRKQNKKYNLVFADPPYHLTNIEEIPDLIMKSEIISKEGWFILEHPGKYKFADQPMFRELRKYGSVHFSIFEIK